MTFRAQIPYNNLSDPIDTDLDSIEEEKGKVAVSLPTNVEPLQSLLNLHSYTNLNKVIRITSYVLRFVNNYKHNSEKSTGNLKVAELFNAEKYWVRYVQLTDFKIEYEEVDNCKNLTSTFTKNSHSFSLLGTPDSERTSKAASCWFIARRGHAVNSDSARTLKSADIELKRLHEPDVQNYFGKKGEEKAARQLWRLGKII
ncbi:uncharacterized protein TNCV_730101 [Trichonephila clavipes]|nr:uncharacterized protein TNCV_730101 [Trichonephila clavipes]